MLAKARCPRREHAGLTPRVLYSGSYQIRIKTQTSRLLQRFPTPGAILGLAYCSTHVQGEGHLSGAEFSGEDKEVILGNATRLAVQFRRRLSSALSPEHVDQDQRN